MKLRRRQLAALRADLGQAMLDEPRDGGRSSHGLKVAQKGAVGRVRSLEAALDELVERQRALPQRCRSPKSVSVRSCAWSRRQSSTASSSPPTMPRSDCSTACSATTPILTTAALGRRAFGRAAHDRQWSRDHARSTRYSASPPCSSRTLRGAEPGRDHLPWHQSTCRVRCLRAPFRDGGLTARCLDI